jgi:GntR family transcriptional regulator, rspAB operon transcriptional repressor
MAQIIIQNSLADKVYDLLKDQILSGELTGGMFIPEEQLAQQFGVSRTPIREAIRRLAEYGLVVLKPRSHAQVYQINDKEARDIARVRVVLERLAVESMTPESINGSIDQLARLAADCQYYLGIGNRAALFEKDSLFHLELVRCANNSTLYNLFERLDAQVQLLRVAQNLPDDELGQIINQHGQLLQYLRNGDIAASKALLYKHIVHEAEQNGV